MNITRLQGLFIQEFYITKRSFEVILDIFVSPIISIIVFGFLGIFLSNSTQNSIAYSLFMGMLLWQIIFIVQYSVSVGSLWNVWSRNLSNMFIAPISVLEYMFAQSVSGIIKAITIFIPSSILSIYIFNFNIYHIGVLNVILFSVNLIFFAISFGLIMLGLIFRYGTRIQAFSWGILPLLQPVTAVFYPVSVLPEWMQMIAYSIPVTYVFEAARIALYDPAVHWQYIGISFFQNIVLFSFSVWFFSYMFKRSRETGQFVRLEG